MKRRIARLRLQEGDILVVNNAEDLRRLINCRPKLPKGLHSVPVVIAPEGIKKVSLKQLKQIVSQLETEIKQCAS